MAGCTSPLELELVLEHLLRLYSVWNWRTSIAIFEQEVLKFDKIFFSNESITNVATCRLKQIISLRRRAEGFKRAAEACRQ